jgi:hypothetical protein
LQRQRVHQRCSRSHGRSSHRRCSQPRGSHDDGGSTTALLELAAMHRTVARGLCLHDALHARGPAFPRQEQMASQPSANSRRPSQLIPGLLLLSFVQGSRATLSSSRCFTPSIHFCIGIRLSQHALAFKRALAQQMPPSYFSASSSCTSCWAHYIALANPLAAPCTPVRNAPAFGSFTDIVLGAARAHPARNALAFESITVPCWAHRLCETSHSALHTSP